MTEAEEKLGAWMSAALDDPNTCDAMKADIREWFDDVATRFAQVQTLEARLTHRAKLMERMRRTLVEANNELSDEGGRVYFGSTNHADDFRDFVNTLDDLRWDEIIGDASKPDYIGDLREVRNQLAASAEREAKMRDAASDGDRAMRFVKMVASQRPSKQAREWYEGEFGDEGEPDFEGAYDSFIEQARNILNDASRAALKETGHEG